ncbi:hypothetical protein SeLEV6574_g00675 [Synchytrium endobioticum]|uniref:Uncharacterized protein n=1 Tax=Synchytrium endobioticum TaxID=286115 RepID=A0A507DGN7_9FUNG|nr:hypothetical protein SeLEV6574_g00675 [Synchytrium endobioticum]
MKRRMIRSHLAQRQDFLSRHIVWVVDSDFFPRVMIGQAKQEEAHRSDHIGACMDAANLTATLPYQYSIGIRPR